MHCSRTASAACNGTHEPSRLMCCPNKWKCDRPLRAVGTALGQGPLPLQAEAFRSFGEPVKTQQAVPVCLAASTFGIYICRSLSEAGNLMLHLVGHSLRRI